MGKQKEKTMAFEMSAVKIQQFNKQPIIENSVEVSEDGKWLMHRTVITDIKPITYYKAVLQGLKD